MPDYFNFTGRVAVVTGGRRGLGKAMSLALARCGAKVVVIARSPEADDILEAIAEVGGEGRYLQADLEQREQRLGLMERARAQFGRVDILINNAGIVDDGNSILNCSLEQWDRSMAVLLDAVFELSQQASEIMIAQGDGGKIILLSSICGFREGGWNVSYATAKTAIVGFTRCLANVLAAHNINVNALAPGIFDTDMTSALFGNPKSVEQRRKQVPSQRFGEPEDIVGPMLFLASEQSRHVHGQTLIVDGGYVGS